jgi:hypothetical protein
VEFSLAIKGSDFPTILRLMELITVALTILKGNNYVRVMVLQISFLLYYKEYNHPMLHLVLNHTEALMGEDIEIFNRVLGQHTHYDSRRGQAGNLDYAYKLMGLLVHLGIEFEGEGAPVFNITKGNRRYRFANHDDVVELAKKFLSETLDGMKQETWEHYKFPEPKRKRKKPQASDDVKESSQQSVDVKEEEEQEPEEDGLAEEVAELIDWTKTSPRAVSTGTRAKAQSDTTVVAVQCLYEVNWQEKLKKILHNLMASKAGMKLKLSTSTIEKLQTSHPEFTS